MTRRTLPQLLALVPEVYEHLEDALVPGRSTATDDVRVATTTVEAPSPVQLDVVEHRSTLVRGLRYWCARAQAELRMPVRGRVGQDIARACAWLDTLAPDLAPETRRELGENLSEWLWSAWGFMGDPEPQQRPAGLPPEAADQVVRVADAAKLLGCTVRTVQRRADRADGRVRLGDVMRPPVPRCELCDLPVGTCPHRDVATRDDTPRNESDCVVRA